MIKEITAYVTTDGTIHDNREYAEKYQKALMEDKLDRTYDHGFEKGDIVYFIKGRKIRRGQVSLVRTVEDYINSDLFTGCPRFHILDEISIVADNPEFSGEWTGPDQISLLSKDWTNFVSFELEFVEVEEDEEYFVEEDGYKNEYDRNLWEKLLRWIT